MVSLFRLVLILSVVLSLSFQEIFVFYSEFTPEAVLSEFSEFKNQMLIEKNNDALKIMKKADLSEFSLILDITFSQSYFPTFDSVCEILGLAYITLTAPDPVTFSYFRFHIGNSYNHESEAISSIISYLSVKNLAVLVSSDHWLIKTSEVLKNSLYSDEISVFIYDDSIDQNESDQLVQKMIKVKGLRNILILDNGNSILTIQASISKLKLNRKGSLLIFFTRIPKSVNIEGSLIVCPKNAEASNSVANFYFFSVLNALLDIDSLFYLSSFTSPKGILESLNFHYQGHNLFPDYFILNVQNFIGEIVGYISDTVEIYNSIIYPGGITNLDTMESFTTITISIANGISEIYHMGTYYDFSYLYEAARYAVYRSNMLVEFPNFRFELFNTDCGIFAYDPTWYKMCLAPVIKNLGIAYMTSLWSTSVLGNILTLRELGVNIPQISALSQDDKLDNKIEYPEFFKLTLSSKDQMGTAILLVRSFDWSHLNIFVSEDNIEMYNVILEFIKENGVYFDNPDSMRVLPVNYTRDDFPKYKSYFEAAKSNNCRIFLIMTSSSNQYIIEGLYDVGYRKGEFITFGGGELFRFLTEETNEDYLKKLRELLPGSFVSAYLEWSGSLGQNLKSEMKKIFPDVSFMCMVYDSFSLIKNTLAFMLEKGLDYEDPDKFTSALRNTNGLGCLGTLSFNRQTNSKASAKFLYQQILFNETSDSFFLKDIIIVDKYSSQAIISIGEIEWLTSDGSIPKNYNPKSDCPFDNYLIRKVYKSRIIFYSFSTFFVLLVLLSGILSSKTYECLLPEIKQKTQISLSDYIFLSYFFIQFFQYLTLGPVQTTYKYMVNNFEILISLDFNLYFNIKGVIFWLIFYLVLGASYIWNLLCLVTVFKIDKRFERNYFVKKISFLCDVLLPLVGHIGLFQ